MSLSPMLSRVADRVYWLARYLERVENTARLINVTTDLMLDLPTTGHDGWSTLIDITGSSPHFDRADASNQEQAVCRFLLSDRDNPGSLISSLAGARENARTIREIMPTETWELINAAHLYARDNLAGQLSRSARAAHLRRLIGLGQQLSGLLENSLSRGDAYEFRRLGSNLERADMTTRIIDVRAASEVQADSPASRQGYWRSILRSLSADSAYRRRMQATISRDSVLDFLLHDASYPRSLEFCVAQMGLALKQLPRNRRALTYCRELSKHFSRDVERLARDSALSEYLDRCQVYLGQLHELIALTYFSLDGHRRSRQQQ
ncbi:MAG: alpha-E domain-containing protein [Pseudomonadota bacterium]